MTNSKRSWRTTLAGIVAILGGVFPIVSKVANGGAIDMDDIATAMAGVSAGVGLIKAKDAMVTGLQPTDQK
jgi:hypothetical protein